MSTAARPADKAGRARPAGHAPPGWGSAPTVYLARPRAPIAREVAITGLFEDVANALARIARAIGVPALATLGPGRDIKLTPGIHWPRPAPGAGEPPASIRLAEHLAAPPHYVRVGAEPAQWSEQRIAAVRATAPAGDDRPRALAYRGEGRAAARVGRDGRAPQVGAAVRERRALG